MQSKTKVFGEVTKGEPKINSLGPTTGEEGSLGAIQTPGKDIYRHNSPDESIKININQKWILKQSNWNGL